jgi:hypothetical protein
VKRICAATGKRIYKRHQAADKALGIAAKQEGEGSAQVPRATYRCSSCRRWHLTNDLPEDVRHMKAVLRLRNTPEDVAA